MQTSFWLRERAKKLAHPLKLHLELCERSENIVILYCFHHQKLNVQGLAKFQAQVESFKASFITTTTGPRRSVWKKTVPPVCGLGAYSSILSDKYHIQLNKIKEHIWITYIDIYINTSLKSQHLRTQKFDLLSCKQGVTQLDSTFEARHKVF